MDWQQVAALAIVAAAVIWLVRTQILAPGRGGCGGCGSCDSTSAAPRPTRNLPGGNSPLIQIDLDVRPSPTGTEHRD